MAQLSDFISRIFSTDRTQGLSGGAEVVIDQDPASSFYASRLRKHRTDEDIVDAPEHLWSTVSFQGRRGGLRAHVHAERGDGVASFTDVLVVLNQADARRTGMGGGEPWNERAAAVLNEKFVAYCEKERFELLYGTRPLKFWFVADGGADMLGQSFNLAPGEFITGLLPNMYVGPAPRSKPVLAIHLNLPGVWEGYREVGRLFSDQILFTLGRHWLDNFHHPALREPGLYRLQQYPDGSLVHVISPELQDRYLVRSDALDSGASVLTLAARDGTAVAYLVLAVIDVQVTMDGSAMFDVPPKRDADAPKSTKFEVPKIEAPAAPAGAPAVGPPSVGPAKDTRREMLQRTIIPDAVEQRILTLQERGALLQKVHFASFMEGYDVYIGAGGRVATQMPEPRATLQVRGNRVALVVSDPGVKVDGRPVALGKPMSLSGQHDIDVEGHVLVYRDLTGIDAEGWPYLGELRRPGAGTYLDFGGSYRIGRDRRCKVRLPDEPHNDNIAWLQSVGSGTTIRSRTGDIPKSRFYTDSIMVASEHAEIDLGAEPVMRSLARHCFTYLRRGDQLIALAPREGSSSTGRLEASMQAGDEVLVGNCLFQVSYPPPQGAVGGGEAAAPAADIPKISPDELLANIPPLPLVEPEPVREEPRPLPIAPVAPESEPPPRRPAAGPANTIDPVAAAGLGELGPAPRMPRSQPELPPVRGPASLPLAGGSGFGSEPPAAKPASPVDVPSPHLGGTFMMSQPPPPVTPEPAKKAAEPKQKAEPEKPPPPMMIGDADAYAAPPEVKTEEAPLFMDVESDPSETVAAVEEAQWKVELARPARLVQIGWMVSGEVVVGNHREVGCVIPEVRAFPEQAFMTLDYFKLFVRGKKASISLLQEGDARILVGGSPVPSTEDLDSVTLEVVRRDQHLEPDFDVLLRIVRDASLPDPRARLLTVDTSDRLVAALFTTGFPLRADRRVRLGPIKATFRFDGALLRVTDYLRSYQTRDGFQPFFVREGDRPWQTFPEDGSRVELSKGDQLICGNAVYRFEA